ncbi:MAG TPA: DUF962 domain-containing protein [Myxococcaceae bacterium]
MSAEPRIGTFAEFWPYYLREHRQPGTRLLHLVGTTLSLLLLVGAALSGRAVFLLAALVVGYAFAWVGHFAVEHNRPATFRYPLWSFAADWKMWALALSGRLQPELRRAGV